MQVIVNNKNKSFSYFLPLFNSYFKIKYFHLLENTYLFYNDLGNEVFCLLYLFDGRLEGTYNDREGYTTYEEEIRSSEYFLHEEDYGKHVLFIFDVPKELEKSRDIIINSKYSTVSDSDKEKIIRFIHRRYGGAPAKRIQDVLYKSLELKELLEENIGTTISDDAELSSLIDLDSEIFMNNVQEEKQENTKNKRKWI